MKAEASTEAAVVAVIRNWLEAYAGHDLDGLMALFSPVSEVVVIGTGPDEKRIGVEAIRLQFERDYAQSSAIRAELGWYSVSAAPGVAWIAADTLFWVTAGGIETGFPLRLTAVLEQWQGRWLVAQWHVSAPAAGQNEGSSW